jgi:Lrp/AsnC family leucine-responsive transcriptional regulator
MRAKAWRSGCEISHLTECVSVTTPTIGPIDGILPLMAQNLKQIAPQTDEALLDTTNLRLLDELQSDARMSLAELGRRVGLSSPAVAERIKRLETAGVIRGYRADVDPRRIGYQLGVVIRIRPAPRQLTEVANLARDTPEVIECNRVTGDDCYVITAYVRDVDHLEALIDQFAAYGQTTSSVLQSSPVPRRAVSTQEAQLSASRPQRRRASA